MRYLLLLVALAAVITTGSRSTFKPAAENPVRTADYVPLPPKVS
jgi:hypothetical protein